MLQWNHLNNYHTKKRRREVNKKKQITIYDISEEAGVSIATVSRVLNDSPKVSRKTKGASAGHIQASWI